ncbi:MULTISPECIES: tRNA adenosine(34) deaminase TadA [unclassified Shewanella]|uniref:tRNA adenosine(34) deaminase TadA n=1 Tax=unclassified Shewanella TaxID=196818 RepID=UPI000C844A5F|nr:MULTISPECIES: tRNA adenosine(34) deaminase TadA [unclassified Shewanella]MDO6619931.1 tRNA adenosine(34) deaminase TadA [Shewanella sp. 6_MG-2023]MDO6641032.1 tRNA adenosine(34) deaminase TadA [Shewanella sp. 5_MG-2023]MDO6679141.1 tRNA adenosine(34) deaminase TadA [Shewanella sp. 4_MG-2023]MDO6776314.1 tRNA adenosine(34) deaminase TadA [Shewanella sp. 3_MG-2023]
MPTSTDIADPIIDADLETKPETEPSSEPVNKLVNKQINQLGQLVETELTAEQTAIDEKWMRVAMAQARLAEAKGEVPVGAVLVKDDELLASGFNLSICEHNPTAHAEIECIRAAGQVLENYRMLDTSLYVTLEPCSMCAGAMVHSRIKRVVFGADDLKTGAAGSVVNLVQHADFNHQLEVTSGVLASECAGQLSAFFKRRREEKKALKKLLKQQSDLLLQKGEK